MSPTAIDNLDKRIESIEETIHLHLTSHVTGTEIFDITNDLNDLKKDVSQIQMMLIRLAKGMPHINFMDVSDD